MSLLLLPLLVPARLILFVAEQLQNHVERELYDPHVLQQRLMEARVLYELGEMSQEDYEEFQALIERQLESLAGREE